MATTNGSNEEPMTLHKLGNRIWWVVTIIIVAAIIGTTLWSLYGDTLLNPPTNY